MVGVAATVLLAAATFVAGRGAASVTLGTRTGTAWLPTAPRGSVTLVDGATGRPSAEITLRGADGHPLRVSQEGDDILVYDPVSGVLTKIDAGRLTAGPARTLVPGLQLVAGPKAAYLIDAKAGTVQPIDVGTLQDAGSPVRLTGRLGQAGVDEGGTLWVPRSDDGMVIPVTAAGSGTPVDVQGRGSTMAVSIVAGRPVVVDATRGRVSLVGPTGMIWSATLPGLRTGAPLLAPATQGSPKLPLLDRTGGTLFVVDVQAQSVHATVRAVADGPTDFGAPVVSGDRAYVPDFRSGSVLVYSISRNAWEPSIKVTRSPGRFESVVRDGIVYFNDVHGPGALVVGADGKPLPVEKYPSGEPQDGPRERTSPVGPRTGPTVPDIVGATDPPSIAPSDGPEPGGRPSRTVGPSPVPPGPRPTPSAPTTAPTAAPERPPGQPRELRATALAGGAIRLAWDAPARAGDGLSYVITYRGGGASGTMRTERTGHTFSADELTFLRTYTFTVRARTAAGESGTVSTSARCGGNGRSFTVDVRKTTSDPDNPCVDIRQCRAVMRRDPTHQSAQTGFAGQGTTVTGYCHKSGQTITNDDAARSTKWILVVNASGDRGFVSTLWLGGTAAYQRVWGCP
ncbi:fibronectin type III domain-containing protein [Actinomadura madurae]|uniref:fibronectin type III domain-containing protein n=1 Tax=Actinomadura madurae TaxID=1993 RepID=UPI002025E731|nr:fibronectin type III domain-containing protein [Actinomadura madurae]URM98888.1 fibronectin type III domain-containing protein [Actinomadura madurae]